MGGFVGEVISFIGRPFGIYTHDETFTDIQISNLLTPDIAEDSARKSAKRDSEGDVDAYFDAYKTFQRDYRKKYSQKFLENLGYNPSSTAQARIVVKEQLETYLESLYGYANVQVIDYGDRYLTLNEKGNHALTNLAGYDFTTGLVTDTGKVYELINYSNGTPSNQVSINMIREYSETIIENLTNNYGYDGTYIYITGEQYLVGVIDPTVNVNDEYETVCTHVGPTIPSLPDETILTPIELKTYIVTNTAYGTEASYASYSVTSGEVGTETRYWVAVADTISVIYNTTVINMTAIIPMKEDNVMSDLNNRNLERMLKRLNLSGEQLRSSIENPDMDSAYLLTGLDVQDNSPIGNKVTFQFFDLLAPGTGDVVISMSRLSMRYAFTMARSTVQGNIGAVGTYTKSVGGTSGAGRVWTLRWQASPTEYQQITVSNYEQTYTVSGNPLTAYLDSTEGYGRIIIPLDILNNLRYREFVYIYERSLCMLAFSLEVVEVKWYETAAFGTLLKIVAIVLIIMSFGASSPLSATLIGLAATAAAALGTVLTLTMYYLVLYVGTAIVMYAISEVLGMIAEKIGGVTGVIVAAAVAAYVGYKTGTIKFDFGTAGTWFQFAETGLSTYRQYINDQTEQILSDAQVMYDNMSEDINYFKDKLAELSNDPSIINTMSYAGVPSPMFRSTEQYVDSMIVTNVDNLADYEMQISYGLEINSNVISGIGT